jgi:outer membrane protein OmpA-like peptidoglycan-associated protein
MTTPFHHALIGLAAAGLLLASLTGCGGPPRDNPLLDEARVAFERTAADQQVSEHAPVALAEAREELDRAHTLWQSRADRTLVDHHAYLAQQRAAIARATARANAAQRAIDAAEAERQQVVLEARTAEAEVAEARARAERALAEAARAEAEVEGARARELAERVQELEAELTHRGLVLTLSDVLFDVGRAELRAGAERTLNELATFLNEYPERRVLIEGHTDSTGSRDLNVRLSQQRADAVRAALAQRGIPQARIRTLGLGPDYPVASNATQAGRQQNRRVEIIISDAQGNIPDRGAPPGR